MKIKILLLLLFSTIGITHAQWDVQLYMNNFSFVDKIQFINETHGWAIGNGVYLYTTNGGENWTVDPDWINTNYNDIFFVNQDTGFIAAPNGIIRKTTNGGQSWRDIQTPTTQPVARLMFADENHGWATLGLNATGLFLKTIDGGETWNIKESGVELFHNPYFLDINNGWFIGWENNVGTIFKTTNGGECWDTLFTCQNELNINLLFFLTEKKDGQ